MVFAIQNGKKYRMIHKKHLKFFRFSDIIVKEAVYSAFNAKKSEISVLNNGNETIKEEPITAAETDMIYH